MESVVNRVAGVTFPTTSAIWFLTHFIQNELPRLNSAIEAGTADPKALVIRLRPLLGAIRREMVTSPVPLNRKPARKLLQLLGFAISSVERHVQATGERPGVGKDMLGPLDDLLIALGRIGEHPPRDTDTTYWYLNRDCRLSFTGDSQEAHFNRVVNLQRQVQGNACSLLRPICDRVIEAHSPDGVQSMLEAAEELQRLIAGYRSFIKPADGGYSFSPDFFMTRMRTYLVGYPVGGELWSGPNAANLAANMSLDYLTGVTAPWYAEVVLSRWRYLVKEDQNELIIDMARSSVTDQVAQALELSSDAILKVGHQDLARYIATQPAGIQRMLTAFAALVDPVVHATGIHFRLIHEYLIQNAKKLTDKEYDALPIKPTKGTGEMAHGKTRQIMDMRRKHPIVSKLLAAIRLVDHTDHNEHRLPNEKGAHTCQRNTK